MTAADREKTCCEDQVHAQKKRVFKHDPVELMIGKWNEQVGKQSYDDQYDGGEDSLLLFLDKDRKGHR